MQKIKNKQDVSIMSLTTEDRPRSQEGSSRRIQIPSCVQRSLYVIGCVVVLCSLCHSLLTLRDLGYEKNLYANHFFDPMPLNRRDRIYLECGELCDLHRAIARPVPGFGFNGETTARVDCKALFQATWLDDSTASAPSEIPGEWLDDFTMGGKIGIDSWFFEEIYFGATARQNVWTREQIEDWKAMALNNQLDFGNYHVKDTESLFHALKNVAKVGGESVLVLGSETPWVEALALAAGARHVTTLEYGSIESQHPQVTTFLPSEFRQSYLEGKLGLFDAVVAYSSIEHSGLGRYGDSINAFGDIVSIGRAWCVTKRHGSLTLALPSGIDKVQFNAHRIYGPRRWPYIATNWVRINHETLYDGDEVTKTIEMMPGYDEQMYRAAFNQSASIFRKTGPPGSPEEIHARDRCTLLSCGDTIRNNA